MKRGAIVGLILGGILGILTAICIVWIGLIFDDSPDGIAPLVMFGLFAALFVAGLFAAMGAVVGVVAKAIRDA